MAFYILQGNYVDGALEAEYGLMNNYLTTGLGLSEEELGVLREQLLE